MAGRQMVQSFHGNAACSFRFVGRATYDWAWTKGRKLKPGKRRTIDPDQVRNRTMSTLKEAIGNRREFFRASGRYLLLGLTSAAVSLMARRKVLPGQKCGRSGI